jgi:hypothetical protein
MVYHERVAWSGLVSAVLTIAVYVLLVLRSAGGGPLEDADWFPVMLWCIGGGIVLSILLTLCGGLIARRRDPDAALFSADVRDRDISRLGSRVEQAFVVIAGLGVIVLCAVGADVFWIAHTMFAGFAVSAVVGAIARVIAYRRGLV